MRVLGVRCSNRDYTIAVLEGTKAAPALAESRCVACPKGFAKPQRLKWLAQEFDGILEKYSIDKVVIKVAEGLARGNALKDRVGHEAVVSLSAGNRGMKAVFEKVKNTIAKDLGQKGRARYLASVDTSSIEMFGAKSEKEQEAILAAWSELL